MDNKHRRLFKFIGVGGASLFLVVVAWLLTVWLIRPDYIAPDTGDWRTGDIFFSVGDSWESVAVRSLTGALNFELSDSTPSHCGLVVRDSATVRLVHASTSAQTLVSESPEEYLKKNGSYCIYVSPDPCAIDTTQLRHIVDSLLEAKIPFDFEFDHSDPKALYCTEMVVTVHELAGKDCFSDLRRNDYIYPEDLLNRCREKQRY